MANKVTPRAVNAPTIATRAEVDAYVAAAMEAPTARLIFALDATASRQPAWDLACQLQAEMFREASGLRVQLVYYRGSDECKASHWVERPERLAGFMERIQCRMGDTQIGRVLAHAKKQAEGAKVSALVFVGDAFEEDADRISRAADALGRLGVSAFMFQEGDDQDVKRVFQEIARRTRGAYGQFDAGAARQLGDLLRAVAVFAVGGMPALAARRDAGAVKLFEQIKRRRG